MLSEFAWNTSNLTIILIFGLPIVSVIGYFWYSIEKTRSDNALKQSMIERGMSPEDIQKVLEAQAPEKK